MIFGEIDRRIGPALGGWESFTRCKVYGAAPRRALQELEEGPGGVLLVGNSAHHPGRAVRAARRSATIRCRRNWRHIVVELSRIQRWNAAGILNKHRSLIR